MAMDKFKDNCGNCYCNIAGQCRRFPPQVVAGPKEFHHKFPEVDEKAWCFEHTRGPIPSLRISP